MANDFSPDKKAFQFYLKDFNFLPSISIGLLNTIGTTEQETEQLLKVSNEIDIWDGPVD